MLPLKLHTRALLSRLFILQNPVIIKIHLSDFCPGQTGEVNVAVVEIITSAFLNF